MREHFSYHINYWNWLAQYTDPMWGWKKLVPAQSRVRLSWRRCRPKARVLLAFVLKCGVNSILTVGLFDPDLLMLARPIE